MTFSLASDRARRDTPKQSKAPENISLSITDGFTNSTQRMQKSEKSLKSPALSLSSHTAFMTALPTPFIAQRPNRTPFPSTLNTAELRFMSEGRTSYPMDLRYRRYFVRSSGFWSLLFRSAHMNSLQ